MQNVVSLLTQGDMPRKYAHVVVDEGQDFSTPAYRVIRALVDEGDNDIFIVGDAQQRIYGHIAVLSKCGIRIQGRARKLRINYRTTEQIRSAADSIFRSSGADVADSVFAAVHGIEDASPATTFDDLDGGESPTGDSRSLMSGPVPEARRFASQSDEMDAVREWIYGLCGTAEDAASDESATASTSGIRRLMTACRMACTGLVGMQKTGKGKEFASPPCIESKVWNSTMWW